MYSSPLLPFLLSLIHVFPFLCILDSFASAFLFNLKVQKKRSTKAINAVDEKPTLDLFNDVCYFTLLSAQMCGNVNNGLVIQLMLLLFINLS